MTAAAVLAVVLMLTACIPPPGTGPGPTTSAPAAPLGPPAGPVELQVVGGHLAFGSVDVDLGAAELTLVGAIDADGAIVVDASSSMTPLPVADVEGDPLGVTVELRLLRDGSGTLDRGTGEVELELDARVRVRADGTTDFPDVGQNCHLGSNANPIELRPTTGTTDPPLPNLPVSGVALGSGTAPAGLVDNEFGVSRAVGCVLFPLNLLVDETVGVPSPAGTNSLRLDVAFATPQ